MRKVREATPAAEFAEFSTLHRRRLESLPTTSYNGLRSIEVLRGDGGTPRCGYNMD